MAKHLLPLLGIRLGSAFIAIGLRALPPPTEGLNACSYPNYHHCLGETSLRPGGRSETTIRLFLHTPNFNKRPCMYYVAKLTMGSPSRHCHQY